MKLVITCMLALSMVPAMGFAQESEATEPATEMPKNCEEAITVFQDVSRVGRKDGAAKNMTQRHEKMARTGWRFADMEVYTENGDLEGFYLSYTRAVACGPEDSEDR